MPSETLKDRKSLPDVTPMMRQYLEVKAEYEDYILMYRLGDFYECFFDDAMIASQELELTLTGRDCGGGHRAAMCGVPYHKSDVYITKLVDRGYKVAICEQVEDPKAATGLVRREVVRVVTPGTLTDGAVLNEGENNYLAAICFGTERIGLAFADVSTGTIRATSFFGDDKIVKLKNELCAYQPAELIMNKLDKDGKSIAKLLSERFDTMVNSAEKRFFDYEAARQHIEAAFSNDERCMINSELTMALGALLIYIEHTQKITAQVSKNVEIYTTNEYLELDYNTRRNLELTSSMRAKEKRGSLMWVLNRTKTAMGERLLRSWIIKPLISVSGITNRQKYVKTLVNNSRIRDELEEALSAVLDLERLMGKAVYGTANARDLQSIGASLSNLPRIKSVISQISEFAESDIYKEFDTLDDISNLLLRAIVDNPPLTIREGDIIRLGFNDDVDYYRDIKENGQSIMKSIEEREKEATGIKTLKVGSNNVFGYYIEVTKSFVDQVPERYIRRQTLTNCERYITQELKEMETTIYTAEEKLVTLEYEIFCSLRNLLRENNERIHRAAEIVAEIDVYRSLAEVASKNGYVCPEIDLSHDIVIKDGRHPVVEKFVTDSYFVPNDTYLNTTDNRLMIITGPNMAGKSTYMRQVAIITIMAQIGSFVPAREARVGIVDKVFTRVGASDDLASGQSTFMLEMTEVATILKNATQSSLIIYDEVGRGTSTYDGMAIARAVVEYTHSKRVGAKTMFATHYHELTDMENSFEGIVNYNIAAKKKQDSIVFLRKIVKGGTDDSYGIEVAKLAGVPSEVVKRAKEILKDIEESSYIAGVKPKAEEKNEVFDLLSVIDESKESEAAEKIRATDINTITPIEAMSLLYELKKMLEG